VSHSPSQLFERQYLWKEAINQIAVLSPNNGILGASQTPRRKLVNSPSKYVALRFL